MERSDRDLVKIILVLVFVVVAVIGSGMYGCPKYNVYSSRMSGQAKLAEAQSTRMARVVDSKAQDEAAINLAEAAGRRVNGWVEAAKAGCAKLKRPGDRVCEDNLIRQAVTYSVAHDGHEGVIISLGSGGTPVAVNPLRASAAPTDE